jgi:hypothetical protein
MLSGPLLLLVPNEAHLRKIKASFRCLRVTTVTCFLFYTIPELSAKDNRPTLRTERGRNWVTEYTRSNQAQTANVPNSINKLEVAIWWLTFLFDVLHKYYIADDNQKLKHLAPHSLRSVIKLVAGPTDWTVKMCYYRWLPT